MRTHPTGLIGFECQIYLIDPQGRYYSIYEGIASFEKTEPDLQCEVIVEYLADNPEQFYLQSWEGTYFEYFGSGVLIASFNKSIIPNAILFTLLDVAGIKDTFVFCTPYGVFIVPQLKSDPNFADSKILVVTAQSDLVWIKVSEPVLYAVITSINYNTDPSETSITKLQPEIALSTMVHNDSSSDTITQNLTYSYLVSDVSTWTTTIGGSLSTRISGKVEIPFLAETGVETTYTVNTSYTWGGSTTHAKTVTSSSAIAIPPMKKVVATILIKKSIIDIPFTYTKSIWYRSGRYEEVMKSGVYHNIELWGVDVQVDDWHKIEISKTGE
ncbi:uncharacterized protein LACBIDRAFT_329415 [Laccaria bicolor S238N-H82]|uniref:Predicted protein n=1 Tax=Laccaria bicolor (strain S238N-H82 / ATCC MYA-4686) TaxID=486041 RepID=B0DHY1_LACBS|nr:uncharacterized protein LACBIDRAFT_329415 [Laccaria bicolor S238N-H82]EDR05809.1 predicted protein [Laccaria bicolor S238N-H82]|eukprot:XP_001883485.1 predicted protein [Laccaria bicolor S238N-H82]